MTTPLTLAIGSTNLIWLTGLKYTAPDGTVTYPTDATVTATLIVQSSQQPVTGAVNLPLSYVAGMTGAQTTYQGAIPASVTLTVQQYILVITATDTSGNVRTFYEHCAAVQAA